MRRAALFLPFLMVVFAVACGSHGGGAGSSGKPVVAVSIFPLCNIVTRIAGPDADVRCVLPPGKSEHDYEPTPREVARISEAKLAIAVGLEMDTWLTRIVRGAAGESVRVVELGPRLNPQPVLMGDVGEDAADQARDEAQARGEHVEEEHHHGPVDPHVWLDPVRMQNATDLIAAELGQLDPAHHLAYVTRGQNVSAQLRTLHEEIGRRRRTWTKDKIVTFHGSMGYYARAYQLTIAAVVEPFPGREPTPRYMTEVLAAISAAHPAALFSEPQLDPRPARVIAQQSGLPLFELDPIGGTPQTNTYEKLLLHNTDVLEHALR